MSKFQGRISDDLLYFFFCYTESMKNSIFIVFLVFISAVSITWIWFRFDAEKVKAPEPQLQNKESVVESKVQEKTKEGDLSQEVSFEGLFEKKYTSPALTVGETLESTARYTKSSVTYQSGELTISGVLYVPKGEAPAAGFPVMVTNHGYIDPAIYTTGRGLKREQNYFVNNGYIVFHPDYRNHADSTKSDEDPIKMRLGYVEDIIHGVLALKATELPLNRERVTLLGHSMGGGASLAAAVVAPDIADELILYAPVSLNYQDSYERYMNDDLERKERVVSIYGTPEANPNFWAGLNGEPYLERLTIPVQIYHGTSDDDVPLAWSQETKRLLDEQEKQNELIVYPGEEHEFGPRWQDFMDTSRQFIEKNN